MTYTKRQAEQLIERVRAAKQNPRQWQDIIRNDDALGKIGASILEACLRTQTERGKVSP